MKRLKMIFRLTIVLFGLIVLQSCNKSAPTYRIGISQCAGGEWRDMQNTEMLVESTFYDEVQLEFRNATDNDSIQIADIQHFIDQKVDLLIISPNTMDALNPIIEKAYDAGIPIVLFDRRISSKKYTAFIGANNFNIGEQAGLYLGDLLNQKGTVVEIENNMNSAPFRERHEGFVKAIKLFPNVKVNSFTIKRTDDETRDFVDSMLTHGEPMDAIYTHIDISCRPVYDALVKHKLENKVITIGVDGMPFKDGGIDRVLEHKQTATFVYPTGGDRIMQVAMNILLHKPFQKENELSTYVIDKHNVRSVRAQQDEFMEQNRKIDRLYKQADKYQTQVTKGKFYLLVVMAIALLLCVLMFFIYRAYWIRNRLNHLLVQQNEKISQQKDEMKTQRDKLIEVTHQLEDATNAKLVFFTNVSHDFRTPLTLISGPLAQLKEHSKWNEPELKLYEIIQKNVGVLLRLVNQIIDFRKYENGKMTLQLSHKNLASLLEDWSNAFFALAQEKSINFQVKIKPNEDYSLDMDEEKIERVFYNLVFNAFKFTPKNGFIEVSLSRNEREGGTYLQMVITDSGLGMSAENIQNIFNRFYKVDSHDSGSGIGLNLAKAFVELHGGNIRVESEEHNGTSFVVELPVVSRDDVAVLEDEDKGIATEELALIGELKKEISPDASVSEMEVERDKDKEMVLVIDDNPDIREYVNYLLSDSYKVVQACNGEQGLSVAQKFIPDAIICDVMMPVMDGLEFCKQAKENVVISHIPVLLLTACSLDEQRVSGYDSGADSYISKPFTAELLLSRVRNLIANRKRFKPNFVSTKMISPDSVKDLDESFVRKFKDLLESNLSDSNLSMDWLSDKMNMSRVQLYRKVKALLGVNPSDLIKEARMKKAQVLLHQGLSVTDVAYEVGFTSSSYFTKCYKEYFGELPTESKR